MFRKFSRVQTSSGLGAKSTVLQSVTQTRSKSKLRWKTFSCSPDRAGPRLTRRRSKVKGASTHPRGSVLLPCGADEFVRDEAQQLLGGAEVTIGVEELVDVAFQRRVAGTESESIGE